jgi:hypothetical protein
MGLSVVNTLEIDDVNYHFARRISYVASTGINLPRVVDNCDTKKLASEHFLRTDVPRSTHTERDSNGILTEKNRRGRRYCYD